MATPGTLVTAAIVLVVLGTIIQFLVLAYRHRNGDVPLQGRTVDGDVVYPDERIDEALYARSSDDEEDVDVDPEETETIACLECRTLNEESFTFCRSCTAKLPAG